MGYSIDLTHFRLSPISPLGEDFTGASKNGDVISFNNYYMEKNGRPFFAVSGEFHYSRMDDGRWEDEIIKMRLGGVNVIATYLFWNHIEEEEGVFDFTGCRNLRLFLELCLRHGMYVILRIGPFDHGEVRNGGLPDWLYGKPFEVRTTDPAFLSYVLRLYRKISEQVSGLFFKDGGPVIGVQLDNEYMHSSAPWEMTTGISNEWVNPGTEGEKYILMLREIALSCGLTPAFFTGTAWGGAAYSPRVMPLWGGYAYRPWIFYSHKGEHPATEEYVYQDYHRDGVQCTDDFQPAYRPSERPYACCEMGGGMMCCYYYRFIYPYKSVDALANIKLGSGCNFIGYYMFQGGTNPLGRHGQYLNESQVPKRSYDYQAALGEFGQIRESYSRLKAIHYFLASFGDRLAPLETVLPEGASAIDPSDLATLRFAVRTDGKRGFLFINNFQDHREMTEKRETIEIAAKEESFIFDISIAADENAILPFNFDMDGILLRQACAQPMLRTEINGRATYVFMVPEGMDGAFRFEDGAEIAGGKECFTVEKGGVQADVLLVSREQANSLFLVKNGGLVFTDAALLEDEKGALRLETVKESNLVFTYPDNLLSGAPAAKRLNDRGVLGAYEICVPKKEIPVHVKCAAPHRWVVKLPDNALDGLKDARLQIDYQGNIGMLFLENEMVSDNFCNGDTWEFGLKEYKTRLASPFVLNIAPLRQGAHVNVESAMAARNEKADALIAELKAVRIRPVYEVRL